MKISNINKKRLKGLKSKLVIGTVVGIMSLTGCNISNNKNNNNQEFESYNYDESEYKYNVKFIFINKECLNEEDLIVLTDEKGYCHGMISSNYGEECNLKVPSEYCTFVSEKLGKRCCLSELSENETTIITIDYLSKTCDITKKPVIEQRSR